MQYDELEPHITPTDAVFYDLYVLSFTEALHVSALLSYILQGADTNILVYDIVVAYRHKFARPPCCYYIL
jgi:hypothetical protein